MMLYYLPYNIDSFIRADKNIIFIKQPSLRNILMITCTIHNFT